MLRWSTSMSALATRSKTVLAWVSDLSRSFDVHCITPTKSESRPPLGSVQSMRHFPAKCRFDPNAEVPTQLSKMAHQLRIGKAAIGQKNHLTRQRYTALRFRQ